MIVLDVNILIASFRADHAHHQRVRPWIEDTVRSGVAIGVPDVVWVGFIRLCTNARVFPVPSTMAETAEFVRAFSSQPGYIHLGGLSNSIEPLLATLTSSSAAANLTTDAYLASIALSLAADVATLDRDFRRFDGLRIVEPPATR